MKLRVAKKVLRLALSDVAPVHRQTYHRAWARWELWEGRQPQPTGAQYYSPTRPRIKWEFMRASLR